MCKFLKDKIFINNKEETDYIMLFNKKGISVNSEFQYGNISMESFAFDFGGLK